MSELVTETFYQSLKSSPSGQRKTGTLFDELYASLETSEKPLDRILQLIAEFHGPWNGKSRELTNFTAYLASITGSKNLLNKALQYAQDSCLLEQVVGNLPPSSINKQDPTTFALMPTPLLREFLNRAQKIHPAINLYIQLNIDTFPYFQPISENVGTYTNEAMNTTEIDPINWGDRDGVNCSDTNTRMNKNTYLKMMEPVFYLMDDANNLINTLFVRALPPDNNMSILHENYSQESPISHGHNFCMDVFNAGRHRGAAQECAGIILDLAQDVLRLVNKFFCIKELARYSVEGFEITMFEGPNNEPITYIVDQSGRPLYDNSEPNNITDPTNTLVIGSNEDFGEEIS
ncbi:MAG TPA: hypothetical protein PKU78_06450 [Candidatus Dojkabacteria bacterium]|nr:hypothetical protein [Candidatus Dojkabacteria bacterium]